MESGIITAHIDLNIIVENIKLLENKTVSEIYKYKLFQVLNQIDYLKNKIVKEVNKK